MTTRVGRRRFIVTLGGAAAWPLAARAQKVPTVGLLIASAPSTHQPFTGAFRAGLREAGYIDGQNVTIEVRLADGHYDRMPGLIRELLDRQVQVLACGSGAGVLAKAETSTVPIVALSAGDRIRSGLVSSFNRPGGNVTAIA